MDLFSAPMQVYLLPASAHGWPLLAAGSANAKTMSRCPKAAVAPIPMAAYQGVRSVQAKPQPAELAPAEQKTKLVSAKVSSVPGTRCSLNP